jgi:ubiquinone biosynthesis monooxygenase Coq7
MSAMFGAPTALTPLDRLISLADEGLKVLFAPAAAPRSGRPAPLPAISAGQALTSAEMRLSGALMRVNHTGEICAQALYQGQALLARTRETRAALIAAAREEGDHLAWCAERLAALRSRPSLLNAGFYAASLAIGAGAALLGDALSLGFLAETERQVESHLTDHLDRLPAADNASRAVLAAMQRDEVRHGTEARERGAAPLPRAVIFAMRAGALVMKRTTYWL